jgi:hypothetical protein
MRYLSFCSSLTPNHWVSAILTSIYISIVKESNLEQRVIVNFNTSTRSDLAYAGVEIEFGDGVVEEF